jgi:hypothetical protein
MTPKRLGGGLRFGALALLAGNNMGIAKGGQFTNGYHMVR